MKAGDVVASIRRDLRSLPALTTGPVRVVRRRYAQELRDAPARMIISVADALLTGGTWPERMIACELLVARADAMRLVNARLVDRWATGMADWGSIDLYGVTVAGAAWRGGQVSDGHLMRWTRSPDRWRRRLALVATVPLNSRARGGTGDSERTLRICRALVDDRDDMVVKALSWALRELSKREHDAVARFMQEEDGRIAARVRREVASKLETGHKVRRRG